jgi:hypothetical protein
MKILYYLLLRLLCSSSRRCCAGSRYSGERSHSGERSSLNLLYRGRGSRLTHGGGNSLLDGGSHNLRVLLLELHLVVLIASLGNLTHSRNNLRELKESLLGRLGSVTILDEESHIILVLDLTLVETSKFTLSVLDSLSYTRLTSLGDVGGLLDTELIDSSLEVLLGVSIKDDTVVVRTSELVAVSPDIEKGDTESEVSNTLIEELFHLRHILKTTSSIGLGTEISSLEE